MLSSRALPSVGKSTCVLGHVPFTCAVLPRSQRPIHTQLAAQPKGAGGRGSGSSKGGKRKKASAPAVPAGPTHFTFVYLKPSGKWYGRLDKDKVAYTTPSYDNEDDAKKAVDILIRKLRGPLAPTNFEFSAEEAARVDATSLEALRVQIRTQAGKRNASSRFQGVHLEQRSHRWQAQIVIPGAKNTSLGRYATEHEAAAAWDAAAWAIRGREATFNLAEQYYRECTGPLSIDEAIVSEPARELLKAFIMRKKEGEDTPDVLGPSPSDQASAWQQ